MPHIFVGSQWLKCQSSKWSRLMACYMGRLANDVASLDRTLWRISKDGIICRRGPTSKCWFTQQGDSLPPDHWETATIKHVYPVIRETLSDLGVKMYVVQGIVYVHKAHAPGRLASGRNEKQLPCNKIIMHGSGQHLHSSYLYIYQMLQPTIRYRWDFKHKNWMNGL